VVGNSLPAVTDCPVQVFNLFFVKENEKKHVVHCLRCAKQLNKDLTGWICLGENHHK
jgi:histone demethylase